MQSVNVSIINDAILENSEMFFGLLTAINQPVMLAPDRANVTITEDPADSKCAN